MKRFHGPMQTVPEDLVQALSAAARPGVRERKIVDTTEERDWYRIENKTSTSADVYIYDEIGMWGTTAADFAKELGALDTKEIKLHINSPGGEVFDGVAIYNTLVNHKAKVTVLVDGLAASAASFIAQAGDSVIMGQGSTMMIHDATGLVWGNAEAMRQTADILDKLSNTIADFYAIRAGGTAAEWRGIMRAETWYTAQEAVDAGLADSVSSSKSEEKAQNRWDLSVFNYPGRDKAPSPENVRLSVMNKLTKEKNVDDEVTPDVEPVPEPAVATEVPPTPVPVVPEPHVEQVPENRAPAMLMVNGVATSDFAAIQAHIDGLEQFVRESKDSARQGYVQNLVDEGKITAVQADGENGLKEFVKTLSDGQYKAFVASWDAAPKLSLFGRHGRQESVDNTMQAKRDRLAVLKDIVKHHRDTNMPESELQAKDSYIEMVKLEAELGA